MAKQNELGSSFSVAAFAYLTSGLIVICLLLLLCKWLRCGIRCGVCRHAIVGIGELALPASLCDAERNMSSSSSLATEHK